MVWSIILVSQSSLESLANTCTDAGTPLSGPRLQAAIEALEVGPDGARPNGLHAIHHMSLATLSHLLAMFLHPQAGFPPDKTSLIVIDDINTLIDADYPRFHQFTTSLKTEQRKWHAGRRHAVLGCLANGLHRFAAINDIAIIVSTGCSTRGRNSSGLRLALVPSIGGSEWDNAIHNKLVVFRDFDARFVGIQKAQGKSFLSSEQTGELGKIVLFECNQAGVLEENVLSPTNVKSSVEEQIPYAVMPSPKKGHKRSYDEIADSEGEDVDEYGWAELDEDALATESMAGRDVAAPGNGSATDLAI
nr:hypothetical protein CFP56_41509 [Quercus suber]